jgi:hypothetical protein
MERVESGQLIVEVLFSNGNKAEVDKKEAYEKCFQRCVILIECGYGVSE